MAFKIVFGVAFLFAVGVAGATAKRAARRHGGPLNQLGAFRRRLGGLSRAHGSLVPRLRV